MLGSLLEGIIRRGVNRQVKWHRVMCHPAMALPGYNLSSLISNKLKVKSNPGQTTQLVTELWCQLLPIECCGFVANLLQHLAAVLRTAVTWYAAYAVTQCCAAGLAYRGFAG